MWRKAVLGGTLASIAMLLAGCEESSQVQQTVPTVATKPVHATAIVVRTATPQAIATSPTTTPSVAITPADTSEVPDVVGTDAIWFPNEEDKGRLLPCSPRERLCMYRYMQENGASSAAARFFLHHGAFLYKLRDLGKVDLALTRWPFWADIWGYKWLLVNGTPEIDLTEYLPLDLHEPVINVWRSPSATDDIVSAYTAIASRPEFLDPGVQWYDGVVEAVTTGPDGAQSFILRYMISPGGNTDTGYRYRIQLRFTDGGFFDDLGSSVLPPCEAGEAHNLTPVPSLATPCPAPFALSSPDGTSAH